MMSCITTKMSNLLLELFPISNQRGQEHNLKGFGYAVVMTINIADIQFSGDQLMY